jgi:hypothetical protein
MPWRGTNGPPGAIERSGPSPSSTMPLSPLGFSITKALRDQHSPHHDLVWDKSASCRTIVARRSDPGFASSAGALDDEEEAAGCLDEAGRYGSGW